MLANLRAIRGYAASRNMEQLMSKLASLNKAAPAAPAAEGSAKAATGAVKTGKKPFKKNHKREFKQREGKGERKYRANNSQGEHRRDAKSNRRANNGPRTVSQYDRFRNPETKKKAKTLNAKGESFANEAKIKASYIRRKVNSSADLVLTSKHIITNEFAASLLKHEPKYAVQASPFAKFYCSQSYEPTAVNEIELELSKDKLGYDTKSRVLRALEQITLKRGFKLTDGAKSGFQYIPFNAQLYPFANTTLPSNLMRHHAKINNLSFIPEAEVKSTFASVVLGKRPEILFDASKNYKTSQLKVNAQVVANSLNNNAQLQVDGLHNAISPVLIGEAPIKTLPQPVLPPMKL